MQLLLGSPRCGDAHDGAALVADAWTEFTVHSKRASSRYVRVTYPYKLLDATFLASGWRSSTTTCCKITLRDRVQMRPADDACYTISNDLEPQSQKFRAVCDVRSSMSTQRRNCLKTRGFSFDANLRILRHERRSSLAAITVSTSLVGRVTNTTPSNGGNTSANAASGFEPPDPLAFPARGFSRWRPVHAEALGRCAQSAAIPLSPVPALRCERVTFC